MTENPKAHGTDSASSHEHIRSRTLDVLTALHDTYVKVALERLCQSEPWHTWQVLAEEVEFRIAGLAPDTHPEWERAARQRELAWHREHTAASHCPACSD